VKLKVPLEFRFLLSNTPVSLVTVWVIPSLFVHFTVVPAVTVKVDGLNAVPCIQTSFAPGFDIVVEPVPVVMPAILSIEPFEQLFEILTITRNIPIFSKNLLLVTTDGFIIVVNLN
jgi:hypothetical protein